MYLPKSADLLTIAGMVVVARLTDRVVALVCFQAVLGLVAWAPGRQSLRPMPRREARRQTARQPRSAIALRTSSRWVGHVDRRPVEQPVMPCARDVAVGVFGGLADVVTTGLTPAAANRPAAVDRRPLD